MLLLIPTILYAIFILWISHHWFHSRAYESNGIAGHTKVTVLIPFKNEGDNIPHLFSALQVQTYPQHLVQFLFVNDHSSDGGELLVKDFTLLHSEAEGKKAALEFGLQHATGELIISLDADCLVNAKWLSTIVSYYEHTKADLIICPIALSPIKTFWEKLQAIEFQSLVASTAGAALGANAIMCNGANLAFRKSLVEDVTDVYNRKYTSGDDMFLLEHAKRTKAKVNYLKSQDAMAHTKPVCWKNFWRQRTRWTSKSGAYSDKAIIASALLVFLTNMWLIVLPFISVELAVYAFMMKLFVDFILLLFSSSFFGTKKILWIIIILTPLIPLYVFVAAIAGSLSRPSK